MAGGFIGQRRLCFQGADAISIVCAIIGGFFGATFAGSAKAHLRPTGGWSRACSRAVCAVLTIGILGILRGLALLHDLFHEHFRAATDFFNGFGKIAQIIAHAPKNQNLAGGIIKPIHARFFQTGQIDGFGIAHEIEQNALALRGFDPIIEFFIGMFPQLDKAAVA
ncbi:hypothetical protein JCM17846_27190 [Iodidimonas nitroreducens]|uniref:Uncharacterized protein n=1 Tax=Iodidimonas nitroreducens TaxID=1236968 RepID=A0A5A7NAT9_9PROT|nr:hypothetical protein JCM17846_27190 [Iodidimonas nitroreducens]